MSSEVEPLLHACPNCAAMLDVSEQEPYSEIQCPSCGNRMRVRTQFDHFQLVEPIASGGMGTVYKARDMNLDRVVALKLLRKEFSLDQDYIEKLETEAKITASVSHPHVVKVFSFGCDQGLYYIAMELVDKGSLDDLMGLQGRIAEVQVLEIGIQVAQGLRAALQAGLIHRDVKPGNILFADARTSKIVDFGLAMPLEQARDAEGGEIWGTPYYVAPEKLNHEPEDFRSDIYSLGGTLFHALAGRPPFEADNASMVALKHIKSQVVSLQAFAPDISSPTAYVINRTLAKNPDERYQSYDELIEHLEYARAKLLENSGKPRQAKERVVVEGEEQQQVLGYILMAVIAFVIILGGILFFFKDNIMARRLSLADIERNRLLKAASSAEESYTIARKLVFENEPESAVPILWQLGNRPNVAQQLKGWIYLQQGIASYLSGLPINARDSLRALGEHSRTLDASGGDGEMFEFFFNVAMLNTQEQGNSTAQLIRKYATPDHKSLALLTSGLKLWENSRFAEAAKLFEAFQGLDPKEKWEWINSYKPYTQHYLEDYEATRALLAKIAESNTSVDASKRAALQPEIEAARKKLALHGRLSDYLCYQERVIGNRGKGIPLPAAATLRAQIVRSIRTFEPDQAVNAVEKLGPAVQKYPDYAALLRAARYGAEFKKQLIDDLNEHGFSGTPLIREGGSQVNGKVIKATQSNIEVQTSSGKQFIPWSGLRHDTIIKLALSMIRVRAGATPDDADLRRLWLCGAYAALIGDRAEALPRLMRAAEFKREYARELILFDPPAQ